MSILSEIVGHVIKHVVGHAVREGADHAAHKADQYLLERRRVKEISELDAQIARNPSSGALFVKRGDLHYVLGHLGDAVRDANEALRLSPNSAEAYELRGRVHIKTGENEQGFND